jgi:hypothetical protein
LVLAGLVALGTSGTLLLGRWLARNRAADAKPDEKAGDNEKKTGDEKVDEDEARGKAEVDAEVPTAKDESEPKVEVKKAAPKKPAPLPPGSQVRIEGSVCQLGDVLMRLTGEEAWLAGGVVLAEEVPVAILFVAPQAGLDFAIYTRVQSKRSVFWLEPLDPSAVLVGGEPPSSVELGGVRFERTRRLPLRPRRIGVGAPNMGDMVMVAEYGSAAAERLLVLKGNSGLVQAYRGLELEEGSFEVIASGDSTLESGA